MSQKGIEQLIGKALADKRFLEDLLKNPEGKIKETGLDISPDELAQIKKVDTQKAIKFAQTFTEEFADRRAGLFG